MQQSMDIDIQPSHSPSASFASVDRDIQPTEKQHPFLPELGGLQEAAYGEFKWTVRNYSQLREQAMNAGDSQEQLKVYSPIFEVHGEKWRILMFPNGNNSDFLSLYLDFASAADFEEGKNWHRCVQLAIRMVNCSDDSVSLNKDAHHRYCPEESDWGFTNFLRISQLTIPIEGKSRPLLENDSFDIYAYVRIINDSTGVLWHNFNNWDSRKETGYVGLKNQGATCYMNSLLQSLYFTNYFRRAVFQIPSEHDEPTKSVPAALQRVFYNLQYHPHAVDTRELTKSFGWDTMDAFMQHDVQEFNRVLQDNLESKMKKTKAEGAIERLFVGKMKSYIKCVNVDYESSREETFYDIQLNVKGMRNLLDSFKDYIAVEMLDGENKYQSEKYGLQDAKKGVIFTSFPPVLHLQLKRFEYDFERDSMVKINDRFEYPSEIDLSEFLDENCDRSVKQEYVLHGVLVHSGDVHGGHYCAFLKPNSYEKWYKFDDDRVTPVSDKDALDENYGEKPVPASAAGTPLTNTPLHTRRIQMLKKFTNAYMLVYIRKSDIPEILKDVTEEDIPSYLSLAIKKEQEHKEEIAKEAAERHMFLNVNILKDEDFKSHQGFDLCNWDEFGASCILKCKKDQSWKEFVAFVAESLHVSPEKIRLWNFYRRQNKTIRPEFPITVEKHGTETLDHIYRKYGMSLPELRLYVEVGTHQVQDSFGKISYLPEPTPDFIVVFIKYYHQQLHQLEYLGSLRLKVGLKGQDVAPLLTEMKKLPPNTSVKIYEEIKPSMVAPLKMKSTLKESELLTGDILCFQQEPHPQDSNPLAFATAYYEHLQFLIKLEFFPKPKSKDEMRIENGNHEAPIHVVLSRRMKYDEVIRRLGEQLKADPEKLRLWFSPTGGDVPKQMLKRNEAQTLHEILSTNFYQTAKPFFWYEITDLSIKDLEKRKNVSFTVIDSFMKELDIVEGLAPKTGTLKDLQDIALVKNPAFQNLKFFEVQSGKTLKKLPLTQPLISIGEFGTQLYAELTLSPEEKVVAIYHFNKDPSRVHSIPFELPLTNAMTVGQVKKKIQSKLGMSEKEIGKVKLAIVSAGYKVKYLEHDDEILLDQFQNMNEHLAIDHQEKSKGYFEKAIKIHN